MRSLLPEQILGSWIVCCGAAGLSACSVGPDVRLPEAGTSTKLHRQPGSPGRRPPVPARWQASTSRNGGARSAILNSFRWSSDPSRRIPISRSRLPGCSRPEPDNSSRRAPRSRRPGCRPAPGLEPAPTIVAVASRTRCIARPTPAALITSMKPEVSTQRWELDVFGKLRREIEASHLDALAAAKARDAVLVAVIANVVQGVYRAAGFSGPTRGNPQEHRNRPA